MAYGNFETRVGEEVGIVRQHRTSGTLLTARFGTVTKINGHGHIFVQSDDREFVFNKRGAAYKDDYGPNLISADRLRQEKAREERQREQSRLAREIERTLADGSSYAGRFFATQERVDALKNLVAEMEKLVDE